MPLHQWLRRNSEHYLMIAAQEHVARRHGTLPPRPPRGVKELFWLRVFVPVYRGLPWPLRHRIMQSMPGSHRQQWEPPPRPRNPAV
ncbi:MAG: hypothetical protein ACRDTX_24385 [Pseudonocardiaceae bacterium]